ncbi:MAG: response regulator [Candidatus Lindowbacteria bacterium]|nr:response regulator [Candidatus Lindowbacteria bacterium]
MISILFVDDDPQSREFFQAQFRSLDCVVRVADSAPRALELIYDNEPDLIFCDIFMPQMDGFQFKKFLDARKNIPVVFLSVTNLEGKAILSGAVDFISKPLDKDSCLKVVMNLLREKAAKATILVVDDEEDFRSVLESILSESYNVKTAENGEAALNILNDGGVDLIITDVHMPVMNGIDLVKRVRNSADLQNIPIIVQTSDLALANSSLWVELNVERSMRKDDFTLWLENVVSKYGMELQN